MTQLPELSLLHLLFFWSCSLIVCFAAFHHILALFWILLLGMSVEDIESLAQKVMLAVDQHNAMNLELWLQKLHARSDGESAVKNLLRAFDVDGNTLLHRCAIGHGDDGEKVVNLLVAARADVNNNNLLGETPLLAAARCQPSPGVVSALLEARADPSHPDSIASETALMELACRGDSELCRLLLQYKADALLRNSHGRTARDLAIENRHSCSARYFAVSFFRALTAGSAFDAYMVKHTEVIKDKG